MLKMCDRFSCLPSALLAEDSELLRMLEMEQLATAPQSTGGGEVIDG